MTALFNAKNKAGKTPLDIAMEHGRTDIAEVLLDTDEQRLDFARLEHSDSGIEELSDHRAAVRDQQWTHSLIRLIVNSDGALLTRIEDKTKHFLLQYFQRILETMHRDGTRCDSGDNVTAKAVRRGGAGAMTDGAALCSGLTMEKNHKTCHDVERVCQFLRKNLDIPLLPSKEGGKSEHTQFQLF